MDGGGRFRGGIRVCPIFPELRPYLEEAWDAAEDGATRVITRYKNPKQNLRTQLERIITRAGHQSWPRLFQNLRATRETELMARFPAKDVATWLGNSEPVAMMHYAMATKASFEAAKTTVSSFGSDADEGEAKSEARNDESGENAKQKAKQHQTEKNGAKSQRPGKKRDNRDLALVGSTADYSGKLPRQGINCRSIHR